LSTVAVVDIGTNSTRLLVAEVDGGVHELDRRTIVTRLGEGVDRTGRLGRAPIERVFEALDSYREAIARADIRTAVMTSAVRDAENGPEFAERVGRELGVSARTLTGEEEAHLTYRGATALRDDAENGPEFAERVGRELGVSARTLTGEEEAHLTYRGATALRDDAEPLLVIDIGGGSTELVVGTRGRVSFHASTQNGVVRHSERHLHHDPPTPQELAALAADIAVPVAPANTAVAVAGTATSCAAIDLGLERYDVTRVEGHVLSVVRLRQIRDRLAALPLSDREQVRGLHPDRAPVIVAGVVILLRVLEAFGLDRVEVSERDILWGVALASTSPA
jgi:exopolyphosphatase / guanosine-5'-triphosphate,3'-diphosphate pyrophosphatase